MKPTNPTKTHARKWLRLGVAVLGLLFVWQPLGGVNLQQPPAPRDGQHDFDFEIGHWNTHISRLQHPLTGSTTWIELPWHVDGAENLGWPREPGRTGSGWPRQPHRGDFAAALQPAVASMELEF